MAENEFSTVSSVPTTVISIFYCYYYHARALCEDCYSKGTLFYSKGTPALLKRYALRYSRSLHDNTQPYQRRYDRCAAEGKQGKKRISSQRASQVSQGK